MGTLTLLFLPHISYAHTRASLLPGTRARLMWDPKTLACGWQSGGEAAGTLGEVSVCRRGAPLSHDLVCQMCLQSHELRWRWSARRRDYTAACSVPKLPLVKSGFVCAQKACEHFALKQCLGTNTG